MLWYHYTCIQSFPVECQGVTQYFPDMAIRLLNVFLLEIHCPPIVLYVTKRIEHCVLALWSIWDKVKFKLHLIRWILLSWIEEGLLVGPGGRDGTEAWISAGSSSSCLRKKSHTEWLLTLRTGLVDEVKLKYNCLLTLSPTQLSQMASEFGRHTFASMSPQRM